jgi:GNAT superfamily N-acetyltransferase
MEQDDVAGWRKQMGQGIDAWASGPGGMHVVDEGFWLMLTGAPSPDVNLALVYDDDPAVLSTVVTHIEQMGCPALLLLAGAARARVGDLPETWAGVGELPFMTIELAQAPRAADARVRRAGPADVEAVAGLLADAFEMPPEIARVCTEVLTTPSDTMTIWLLEQDGEPVCTVTACRVDDVVSLWSMATPERFRRRGFGRSLLAAVLEHFLADGAKTGLLGATPAGLSLYEATGWQHVEAWQVCTNAVSAQFSH